MDMGMEPKLLTPSMQHSEEANFRAAVSRIAGDFQKCFGTGTEQQIVDDLLFCKVSEANLWGNVKTTWT